MNSRSFPDAAFCKTRHVHSDLCECLAEDAHCCPYAMAFGYGFYCKHPERRKYERKGDKSGK